MKVSIADIATLQSGLFAKPTATGELVYLQAKHFDERGMLKAFLHPDIKAVNITEKHLLRNGDVLFAAKGTKNFAAVYETHNDPAVASTSFFVIRLKEKSVLPEFLMWFLNRPSTQKFLKRSAIGTSIPSISKSVLEDLEISIPAIETQKAILQIAQLCIKEKELKDQIESLREKQINQRILNMLRQ